MGLLFQSIRTAIAQNPYTGLQVVRHRLPPPQRVECFKLPTLRIEPTPIPKMVKKVRLPSPVRSEGSDRSEEFVPPPPMPRRTGAPTLPTVPTPSPPSPPRSVAAAVPTPKASTHPTYPTSSPPPSSYKGNGTVIADAAAPRIPTGPVIDPTWIAVELQDAMYAIANPNTRVSLECEEARRLEGRLADLYKNESGRSRGWVKCKLEAFLQPRAAAGSRCKGSATPFDWLSIWTDKEASATLDFLCLAKGIRLAVWNDAARSVGLWPAADASTPTSSPSLLYHVTATGVLFRNESTDRVLPPPAGWTLVAPLSVEHSLEKLTLGELDSIAERMGLPIPLGKKPDKVRALASARMRIRITGA